jgi:hypothetical protein
MRVYDPRNFEFEIDMDNLSCILMNADVSKSEINEKCVFGWSGKDLVLIPVSSHEYKEAIAYTALQKTSVTTKDLVKGLTYKKKKITIIMYTWVILNVLKKIISLSICQQQIYTIVLDIESL